MIVSTNTSRSNFQVKIHFPRSVVSLVRDRKNDVHKLYWMRHKDHTDPRTEGYIGMTKTSLTSRITTHLVNAYEGFSYKVYNALRKYKEDVVVDLLCVGTLDVIQSLEYQYRDKQEIGWNTDTGGRGINSETMKDLWASEKGEIWRERRRERHKENPSLMDKVHAGAESFRLNGGLEVLRQRSIDTWKDPLIAKGRREGLQKAHEKRMSNYKNIGPWVNGRGNLDVWADAKRLYRVYKENEGIGRAAYARLVGRTDNEICSMFRSYFKKGWNPYEDDRWIHFFEQGGREEYGK